MGNVISMKFFSKFRMLAMLAVALMAVGIRAEAQSFGYSLSVSGTPNPAPLNSNLTYTINLTNLAGTLTVYVTNTLDVNSTLISTTNVFSIGSSGFTTTNGNVVIFSLIPFGQSGIANMTVVVQPTAVGLITNTVAFNFLNLTNFSINIINQVTNLTPFADLAVSIAGPASTVFTNDWMTYGVSVTNLGPSAASNVMLTNMLPAGVGYLSVSPAGLAPSIQGSNVIFNLGTLASGAFTNLQLTVQPTNAGTWTFSSFVNSTSVTDTNLANNTATNNIIVTNYFSASLVAYTNSVQIIDFQNALTEQSIAVSNAGLSSVAAVRVVVTGLTNQLFNAAGTNNGNPFVVYGSALNPNQSTNLLLQFYPRSIFRFTNGQLHAFAVSVPNLAPPPVTATSTNIIISRIIRRADGSMLLIWPSTLGQAYTVVYSDNVLFSNAMIAPPTVVAPANQTPWIDYGPPGTVSQPTNSAARFYRIYLNP
jgi:uncharacterized repeat protein (TIGR01451 family)